MSSGVMTLYLSELHGHGAGGPSRRGADSVRRWLGG